MKLLPGYKIALDLLPGLHSQAFYFRVFNRPGYSGGFQEHEYPPKLGRLTDGAFQSPFGLFGSFCRAIWNSYDCWCLWVLMWCPVLRVCRRVSSDCQSSTAKLICVGSFLSRLQLQLGSGSMYLLGSIPRCNLKWANAFPLPLSHLVFPFWW